MNIEELEHTVNKNKQNIDFDGLKKELSEIEDKLQSPEVWSNQNLATELGQKSREIKETLDMFSRWDSILEDAKTAQEIGDASVTATLGAPFEGGRHERPFHDESGTQRLVQACEGWHTSNIVQDGGLFGERGTPSFALGSRRAAPFTSCAALTMKWVTRQTCRDNPTRRQEGNLGKIIVF